MPSYHPVVRGLALAVAAAMAAFLLFGAQQVGRVELFPGPYLDKLAHATYYGLMALLLDVGLGGRGRWPVAVLLAIGVGATDEVHQIYVPGRDPSVFDWLADVTGALAAVGLWRTTGRLRRGAPPR